MVGERDARKEEGDAEEVVGVRGSAEEEEVTGRGNEGSQDQSNLSKEGGSGAQGVAAGSEAYDVAAGLNASIERIAKTRFSNTDRVVFVAGLEGTGHHLIGEAFATAVKGAASPAEDSTTLRCTHAPA